MSSHGFMLVAMIELSRRWRFLSKIERIQNSGPWHKATLRRNADRCAWVGHRGALVFKSSLRDVAGRTADPAPLQVEPSSPAPKMQ